MTPAHKAVYLRVYMDVVLFKEAAIDLQEACDGLDKMFGELTLPSDIRQQATLLTSNLRNQVPRLEKYSGEILDDSPSDLIELANASDSLSAWAGLMTDDKAIGALNRVADFFRSLAQEKIKSE